MVDSKCAQEAFDALDKQYVAHIKPLKFAWIQANRVNSRDVYEVMTPDQQDEIKRRLAGYPEYITPLAEAWWRERGYGVTWPDDDSQPMNVYKLAAD